MSNVKKVTTDTFRKDVIESDKPVIVDFWAEWCGPCKKLSPILEEVAEELDGQVTVAKVNVDEELTRLKSHILQITNLTTTGSSADGSVGKKLDFLAQELNREANTIGSKSNNLELNNLVLKAKAEIEKIREQVQNIE